MKVYHKDVYMPEGLKKVILNIERKIDLNNIIFSLHIEEHLNNNDMKHEYSRKDILDVLSNVKRNPIEPFEATTIYDAEKGKERIVKFCFRTQLDAKRDISISFNHRANKVITAWVNNRNDLHYTLNREKYVKKY